MKQQQQVMIVVALVATLMVIMWRKSTHQQFRATWDRPSSCEKQGGSSECYGKVMCGDNQKLCPRGNCNQCCNNHTRGNKGYWSGFMGIGSYYCKDDIPGKARLSEKRRNNDMGFTHDIKCSSVKDVQPCHNQYGQAGRTAWYGPL